MAKVIRLKPGVMRELRKSPPVMKALRQSAERIADKASNNGKVTGYLVTDLVLEEPRGAVSVMATGEAARHNRKHNSLIRALDAGRV